MDYSAAEGDGPEFTRGPSPIAIIGAGSWGTALSIALARAGWRVRLWARRRELAEAIGRQQRNPQYLPECELPDLVTPTGDLAAALAGAAMVLLAVPSDGIAEVCEQLAPLLPRDQGLVCAAKGLEHPSGRRLSQVITDRLGPERRLAVLSGPNLAPEVAAGIASATVTASRDRQFAALVQRTLATPHLRVYTNPDLVGVELGGALKNIIAIAAGASDGLGFGDNTKAALITRGLAEITRLGVALGARAETFRGLSGMGDLVATCAGPKSRNYRLGLELAGGSTLADALAAIGQVAEGVHTTRAALGLAAQVGVEMPIAGVVHALLFEGLTPKEAVPALMTRAARDELEG